MSKKPLKDTSKSRRQFAAPPTRSTPASGPSRLIGGSIGHDEIIGDVQRIERVNPAALTFHISDRLDIANRMVDSPLGAPPLREVFFARHRRDLRWK